MRFAAGPTEVAGGRRRRLAGVAFLAVAASLLAVELAAPREITFGAATMVPVIGAWAFAERRLALGVIVLAVGSRCAVAALGDIPPGLAAVEVLSYLLIVAAMSELRPAAREDAAAAPEAVPAAQRSAAPAAQRTPVAVEPPVAAPAPAAAAPAAPLLWDDGTLTPRERQVVELAARGLTAAQIADRLVIGRRTVETHLSRAYGKLGLRSKQDLIARHADAVRPG